MTDLRDEIARALVTRFHGESLGDVWSGHSADLDECFQCDEAASTLVPIITREIAAAEQRGRADNANHAMCYVAGSKALETLEHAIMQSAFREAAAEIEMMFMQPGSATISDHLRRRADAIGAAP